MMQHEMVKVIVARGTKLRRLRNKIADEEALFCWFFDEEDVED